MNPFRYERASDVSSAIAVEMLHPPCALKFEIGY